MQAPVVQSTSSIRVIVEGNVATDHPELVSAMASAWGEVLGEVELAGV